jgi:hypothetical protein
LNAPAWMPPTVAGPMTTWNTSSAKLAKT